VGLVFRGSGFYTTDYRRPKDGASKTEEGKKPDGGRKTDAEDAKSSTS